METTEHDGIKEVHVTQVMTNGGNADEILNSMVNPLTEIKPNNLRQGNHVIIPIASNFGPVKMFNSII